MLKNNIEVYIDGGSRGNPGISGGGFVILKNGKLIDSDFKFFGQKTNNQAEYLALELALKKIHLNYEDYEVHFFMDSKLAVEQMNGNYKVKSANIKPIFQRTRKLADQIENFSIKHIPREENNLADELANKAMDIGY